MYHYSGNQVLITSDPAGLYVDLYKVFHEYNPNTGTWTPRPGSSLRHANQLINDLRLITGLDLQYDPKTHRLIIASNKINGGSKTARDILEGIIENKNDVLKVVLSTYNTTNVNLKVGNVIVLNPRQIEDFTLGAVGVNKSTMGLGMTMIHEFFHTKFGGTARDPKVGTDGIELPDMVANTVRTELGTDWGQRINYHPTVFGKEGERVYYLPFTQNAADCLEAGVIPESGFVRFNEKNMMSWIVKLPGFEYPDSVR